MELKQSIHNWQQHSIEKRCWAGPDL